MLGVSYSHGQDDASDENVSIETTQASGGDPMAGYEKDPQYKFSFTQFPRAEKEGVKNGSVVLSQTGKMPDNSTDGAVAGSDRVKPLVSMWKLALSTLLVLSLLVGFLYVLKKFGAKYAGIKTDDIIRVTSKVQVDSKNSLMMLRVYEDELLVGVGDNGITLLSRFNQIENEDELIADEKVKQEQVVFEKTFVANVDSEDIS